MTVDYRNVFNLFTVFGFCLPFYYGIFYVIP